MSLRRVIKLATGQDINICHACFDCDVPLAEEMDIPLGSLVQLALLDDDEALDSRTLWSDAVLEASHGACKRGLNLRAVMIALREESLRRRNPET
jgi:hypothetical protein